MLRRRLGNALIAVGVMLLRAGAVLTFDGR